MDDEQVVPRAADLWLCEPRSLQTKVSHPVGLESRLQPWPCPHTTALPHLLVLYTILGPLEPHSWRKALPWVRVRLRGLGGWESSPEHHPASGAGLWVGWAIIQGLTSTPLAWLPWA